MTADAGTIAKHFYLTKAVKNSLKAQGLNDSDSKVELEGNKLTIRIKRSVSKDDFEIKITADYLKADSKYASKYYKELVVLDGGTQQNLVTLTPKTTTFKLYREGVPIEMKMRKTFEGISASETGIDTSRFAFVVWDEAQSRFLNFDLNNGQYSYNGTTARSANGATQLLLNANGEINLDDLPSNGDYYFYETKAPANWNKMVDQPVPYEPVDGIFTFDNHGEGTGHLVFSKYFFDSEGIVQYTKDSTGEGKERYNDGIANATFELRDLNDNPIGVSGSNGKYTYSEGSGNQMKLDPDGQLYVDQLPTGAYVIVETVPEHWRGANDELVGEKVYTELINVSLNEATTVDERHQKAIELGNVGSDVV